MSYAPAHQPHLTKHNNQMFEFDSPATIAKHQQFQQQQPMVQAGGAPTGLSVPIPPPPPALSNLGSRKMNLRTRDWSSKPLNAQGNSFLPPTSLQKSNSFTSGQLPVYLPSNGHSSISSTTSSPRTPSLLGVYDPKLLAGQTTHLQSSPLPSSSIYPSSHIDSLHQGQSGLHPSLAGIQSGHSGLPSSSYHPSSTIPLSHNFHLPSSQLSQSTFPTDNLQGNNFSGNQPNGLSSGFQPINPSTSSLPHAYPTSLNSPLHSSSSLPSSSLAKSGIPPAPAFTGYRHGSWRSNNRSRAPLRLRTKDWGMRSENGWSGFQQRNVLDEPFLRNRATFAPPAPALRPMFAQRKWRSGPYKSRPLRTHNWGLRNENGWANFNRNIYSNEATLPFNLNRQRWSESSDLSRAAPLQQTLQQPLQQSLPLQQSFQQPIMQQQLPLQQTISQQSFQQPIMATPLVAPLAATPLAAPLTGRKGRRAAKKAAKQQAIQNRLVSSLAPPVGDPAVNHYRRGAKATVPLAGPAVGLANPTGSVASRRTGRRNNLGRRRNRLAAPALPVPAVQPPVVATQPIFSSSAPLSSSYQQPILSSYQQPILSSYQQQPIVSAGIPLNNNLYNAQLLQKQQQQQSIINNVRPIGSANF